MHALGKKPAGTALTLFVLLFAGLGATEAARTGQKARQTKRPDRLSAQPPVRALRVERPLARRRAGSAAADRVLVRFRDTVTPEQAESALISCGFPAFRKIPQVGVYCVRTLPGSSVAQTLAFLRRVPGIEQARPDYRARLTEIPDDTFFMRYQYALHNRGTILDIAPDLQPRMTAGADIKAPAAWDAAKGSAEVIIAILDSGVDGTHPDLAAKVVSAGRDFVNGDDDAADDNWHGTNVAGIAAADTDNLEGVAGVAWACRILPVKVADAEGMGYYSWIIDGIVWAADQGVEVVAAAGNDFGAPVVYPAAYDDYVLAVAATDYNDEAADFSSAGPEVDVAAPGVYILGPVPQWYAGEGYYPYTFASGTSQAAPHVAGLAALIMALKPELGPDDVMKIIRYTADDVNRAAHPGRDVSVGYGRINMARALAPTILD
jgi:subtilisin family serine protease